MVQSKDEIIADAILDAATPTASKESVFPELGKKEKPAAAVESNEVPKRSAAPKKPRTKETSPSIQSQKPLTKSPPPQRKGADNPNALLKGWEKMSALGLGFGGKVIILLIVIGVFSEIVRWL